MSAWDLLDDLCSYFYDNKDFYRKMLSVEGQNSFLEYFRDIVVSIVSDDIEHIFGKEEAGDFYVDFYTDAFVAAIKRWLLQKDCIPASEFVFHLKKCVLNISKTIVQNYSGKME